jgi:hypothetical protein
MTEAEWLACDEPMAMLRFVIGYAGERKLRLFACACTRLLWDRLHEGVMREAIDVGERFADGLAPWEEAQRFVHDLHNLVVEYGKGTGRNWFVDHSDDEKAALSGAISCVGHLHGLGKLPENRGYQDLLPSTGRQQPRLLRDIFQHPFHPVAFSPKWRTRSSYEGARGAYAERLLPGGELDPVRLADVAKALEEAGCSDLALLGHLRSPGPHVRGCWALDLVLGKG